MAKYGFPFFRPGKNKGNIRRKYGAGRVAALLLCLLVLAPAGRAGSFRSLGMVEQPSGVPDKQGLGGLYMGLYPHGDRPL